MKTVFIGDTHGRDLWKQIVEVESDADKIIFLGDYFDSFDISGVVQLHNFNEIVEFKKNSDKEIVLLFGNHDHHYAPGFTDSPSDLYHLATVASATDSGKLGTFISLIILLQTNHTKQVLTVASLKPA